MAFRKFLILRRSRKRLSRRTHGADPPNRGFLAQPLSLFFSALHSSRPVCDAELSRPQLGELGTAMDALGQGERHLAGVVIDDEHYRHAASVEPDDVSRAAGYLEFNRGNRGSLDLYDCLLPLADPHLLDPPGVGAHHRV